MMGNPTLEQSLTAAQKTIAVLMDRVERNTDAAGNLQALFEHNYKLQQEISAHILEELQLKKFNENLEDSVISRTKELDKANKQLKKQNILLKEMTIRDGLTGLFNRRHLELTLNSEFERAKRYETELSLLIIDLDLFKKVNDNHGHEFGDYVLKEFSNRLNTLTRATDSCFRFGGEEFVLLMAQTDLSKAMDVANKIRSFCEVNQYKNGCDQRRVTISIGVASQLYHKIKSPDELISVADQALFQAKAEGRNQVRTISIEKMGCSIATRELKTLKNEITRLLSKTKHSSITSIKFLAQDMGQGYNEKHLRLIQRYLGLLGSQLGLPQSVLKIFSDTVSLQHCIHALLYKQNKGERIEDLHYQLAELTDLFDLFSNERSILLCLDERFDGTGSPNGLTGDEIPMGARIFAIAKGLASMAFEQVQGKTLTSDEMIKKLAEGAGSEFDPQFVLLMLDLIQEHRLFPVSDTALDDLREKITHSHITT